MPRCAIASDSVPLALVTVAHRELTWQAIRVAGGQVGRGHPPGLPDGSHSARQRHRLQEPGSLESRQVSNQELAAPDRAVGAVPGAIEGDPDDRPVLAIVGDARGDVGVMVLNADQHGLGKRRTGDHAFRQLSRVLGGQVVRVKIMRDHARLNVEKAPEVLDAVGE